METINDIDALLGVIELFTPDTYQLGSRTEHKRFTSIAKGREDNTIEIGGEVLTCISFEEDTVDGVLTVKCKYSYSGDPVDLTFYKNEVEVEDES